MPQLKSVAVRGLLGRFDHKLSFAPDWDFKILYGPNGVGKTKLLELITYAIGNNADKLATVPFDQVEIAFDDGAMLTVVARTSAIDERARRDLVLSKSSFRFELITPAGIKSSWTRRGSGRRTREDFVSTIESILPVTSLSGGRWRDGIRRDVVSTSALIDRYADELPELRTVLADDSGDMAEDASTYLATIDVHLIETQRLLTTDRRLTTDRHPRDAAYARAREEDAFSPPTVRHYALDLAARLQQAMTENSSRSQVLDSSFPRRVLEGVQTHQPPPTEEAIRARYDQQNDLRESLSEIAVLDVAPEVPLPERSLADWERTFVWQYLEDTDEKLAVFRNVLDRVALFKNIVNSRFLFKEMRIDRKNGFRFETDAGRDIAPANLSSGEQHELVLTYDLLFRTQPNSLVLIDEPEISLHVAWQQEFVADISKIAQIANLRFIVATHSPQVIHHWWEHAVALGPFEKESLR